MKKFFEEHGGVAIILIVIAVLLVLVGSVKGLDEGTGKVNGSGIASIVGNAYFNAIDKFKDSFDNVLSGTGNSNNSNPTSGPNGEPLVSTTESQVGKYADIDGDGAVDGIIFADLIIGGSGTWNDYDSSNSTYNNRGAYTIPTISSSKDYYVSQASYTDNLGGAAEVLTATGSGADRFYIMALSDISSNYYNWYYATHNNKINDYNVITSQNFGNGKYNTTTMISKWNSKAYGEQNTCANHKDMWGQIQTQASNGWFVPSSKEWATFAKNIGITTSNYLSKGLYYIYWSSSLYNTNLAYIASFEGGGIDYDNGNDDPCCVRLAATF